MLVILQLHLKLPHLFVIQVVQRRGAWPVYQPVVHHAWHESLSPSSPDDSSRLTDARSDTHTRQPPYCAA